MDDMDDKELRARMKAIICTKGTCGKSEEEIEDSDCECDDTSDEVLDALIAEVRGEAPTRQQVIKAIAPIICDHCNGCPEGTVCPNAKQDAGKVVDKMVDKGFLPLKPAE